MGTYEFSEMLKKAMMFIWFGSIGGVIISFFTSNTVAFVIITISSIIAFIYYTGKCKSYSEEAKKIKSETPRPPIFVFAITILAVLVLNLAYPIVDSAKMIKNRNAREANYTTILNNGVSVGDTLEFIGGGKRYTRYYDKKSESIGYRMYGLFEVKKGDKVTVLDSELFQPEGYDTYFVKVSHPEAVANNETRDVWVDIQDVKKSK